MDKKIRKKLDTDATTGVPTREDLKGLNLRTTLTQRARRGKTSLVLHTRYRHHGVEKKVTKTLNLKPTKRNRIIATRMIPDAERDIKETLIGIVDEVPFSSFALECFEVVMKPPHVSQATSVTYENLLVTLIGPFFGDMDVKDITPRHIDAFVDAMFRAGYSPSYTKAAVAVLGNILKRAHQMGFVETIPRRTITFSRNVKIDWFDREERKAFFKYTDEHCPAWGLLFQMLLETGMRVGELTCLHVGDVDMERKYIRITKSWDARHRLEGPTKTKKTRNVLIGDDLHGLLEKFLAGELGGKKYLCKSDPYLFGKVSGSGRWGPIGTLLKLNRHMVGNQQTKICDAIGIRRRGVHIWRHTCASVLARSGKVMLHEIQMLLGHATVKTTEIYAHLIPPKTSLSNRVNWY